MKFSAVLLFALAAMVLLPVSAKSPAHRRDPYVGAISVDARTGRVLFSDKARQEAYPASCTKLMTVRLVLKALRLKRIGLDDYLVESAQSVNEEPSRLDLKQGDTITVKEGLYALMLKSANDVAVMFAEKICGKVPVFVELMNEEARALGMKNTVYVTPNGLPPPRWGGKAQRTRGFDRSTAEDLSILGLSLIRDYPEILAYTAAPHEVIELPEGRSIPLENHNNLLLKRKKDVYMSRCDGLKTGYIDAGGSSIVATAHDGDRRVLAVVVGSINARTRDLQVKHLLEDGLLAL